MMDIGRSRICRLCLEIILNNSIQILDEVKASMLKILSCDLDFLVTDAVICRICSEKLQKSFDFKMACLGNNDYLKTFQSIPEAVLHLENIVINRKIVVDGMVKIEQERPCRFCLKYSSIENLTDLSTLESDIFLKDMLSRCCSEIDLALSDDPCICCDCLEIIQNQFNFIVRCFDSNEIIKNYIASINSTTDVPVDLYKVFEFTLELKQETDDCDLKYVKIENDLWSCDDLICDIDVENLPELKMNLNADIKIENKDVIINDLDGTISVQDKSDEDSRGDSKYSGYYSEKWGYCIKSPRKPYHRKGQKLYSCYHCPYKTYTRASFILHLWVHTSPEKSPKFKCEVCSFETKWRTSLNTHRYQHMDKKQIKMHKCTICKYKSKYTKHLRRHMKIHLKSEKYKCQCCGFSSNYLDRFKKHVKMKHGDMEVKQEVHGIESARSPIKTIRIKRRCLSYKCTVCSYKTNKKSHIEDHIMKHKSKEESVLYGCDLCSFKSKYKASLSKHQNIHYNNDGGTKRLKKRRKNIRKYDEESSC